MPNLITIEAAARETALPARTIRAWVSAGKLASLPPPAGNRGRRVNLVDVRRLASSNGRATAVGNVATAFNEPPESASGEFPQIVADLPADTDLAATLPAGLLQLRDEWTMPFIDRIGTLERQMGALEARNEALQAKVDELAAAAVKSPSASPWWQWIRARVAAAGSIVV